MKRIIAALVLSAPLACLAAPPSAASIEDLLVVSNSESMMTSMYAIMEDSMRKGVEQATAGKPLTPEQQRVAERIPARLMEVMRQEMSWAKLKPMFVQVYQETLTQEDVDGLLAFYRTPAGRTMIEKMPAVMQRTSTIMQAQMPELIGKLQAAMAEELRVLQETP